MHDFPERDWKLLSSLKPTALNRYCTRVLEEIQTLTADTTKSPHQRYLALFPTPPTRPPHFHPTADTATSKIMLPNHR